MSQANSGFAGYAGLDDDGSEFNRLRFHVNEMLARVRTAIVVEVATCTNDGGVEPAGRVSVRPLVNQVDGNGNSVAHGVINGLIYLRVQGGLNAIIMDPAPGDIGLAVFCDRDISAVKASKARANPGSWRRFDMADGFYIGGSLNAVPVNYLQFDGDGNINVVSTGSIGLTALGGPVMITSSTAVDITATAGVNILPGTTLTLDGIPWETHTHGNVMNGGGNTGPPV